MLCTDCQNQLSDYIDSSLDAGVRSLVEDHLNACSPCRGVLDDLLQIVHFSRQLKGANPEGEMWSRVKTEIEADRSRTMWSRFADARITLGVPQLVLAVVVLIVALSAAWLTSRRESVAPVVGGSFAANSAHAASVQATIQEIEQRINRLDSIVELRRSSWSPELRSMFDRQMLYVDQSLAECRHGLTATPGDDVYEELMLGAYREKVRLLEEFSDY
jgi:hypothetical protein